jgi:hypothetical protein
MQLNPKRIGSLALLLCLTCAIDASASNPAGGSSLPTSDSGETLEAPTVDAPGAGTRVQYLSFQVFTYGPSLEPGSAWNGLKPTPRESIEEVTTLLKDVRDTDPERQLAISFGPLALDHSDEQMREVIQKAFALGRQYDVAVSIHLDDSMFWKGRSYLHSKVENVEWTDWNRTIHKRRVINWVGRSTLAPPMCYESPEVKAEIARIAEHVIGDEIMKHVAALRSEGKADRFAGVIAGWETRLEDDTKAPKPPVGYCSLFHKGFSEANPPADRDAELDAIVRDHAAHWAKQLARAGIPAHKIFTHLPLTDAPVHAAPKNAVNNYSRPGYSVYGNSLWRLTSEELEPLLADGWINAEGTNVLLHDPFDASKVRSSVPQKWETYLARQFNNGAVLVNLFGWQGKGQIFGDALRDAEAVAAYKKFLRSEALVDDGEAYVPTSSAGHVELRKRMSALPDKVRAWVAEGGDPRQIQELMAQIDAERRASRPDLKNINAIAEEIERVIGASD